MKDIAQERKERRGEDSVNKAGRVITRSKVKKKKSLAIFVLIA